MKKNTESRTMHWMPIGMSLGMGAGLMLGAFSQQLPIGMCIGVSFGMAVGLIADRISRKRKG